MPAVRVFRRGITLAVREDEAEPNPWAGLLAGSEDGRGCWKDNVMIERLWRSLKYQCVYQNAFETSSAAHAGIGRWIDFYNTQPPFRA